MIHFRILREREVSAASDLTFYIDRGVSVVCRDSHAGGNAGDADDPVVVGGSDLGALSAGVSNPVVQTVLPSNGGINAATDRR